MQLSLAVTALTQCGTDSEFALTFSLSFRTSDLKIQSRNTFLPSQAIKTRQVNFTHVSGHQ